MIPILLASLALSPVPAPDAPEDLVTRITEVTVFPNRALVKRTGTTPGSGTFVLRGLPWALDPDTMRVRCAGGDVVGLEARTRVQETVPTERVQALRARLRELQRAEQALVDERSLADDVKGHLQRLLTLEEHSHAEDVARGEIDVEAWRRNLDYVTSALTEARKELRELEWRIAEERAAIADVERDLGLSLQGERLQLRDVHVEVLARGEGPLSLELEYLVAGAGWRPRYDLRTSTDARTVDLDYRAQVWQESGEDWADVTLVLSTARPDLGAQGPEPEPVWLRLLRPDRRKNVRDETRFSALRRLGYVEGEGDVSLDDGDAPARPFASVQSQGLSLRYRLATRETVESRREPSTVLVGQASLDARPEYHVVPSLDTNVWLRGVAKNSTEWTLLPGDAAVFFGADYVGEARIGLVQPTQELTLHLGADPALSVERVQTEDMTKGPGIFGSRKKATETWVVRVENHGAASAGPQGTARVFVREALPRSTDKRVEVKLAKSTPASSEDSRWQRDLEEKGVRTWVLDVPRGGSAELSYRLELSYPKAGHLAR